MTACERPRTPDDTALPSTRAVRGAGLDHVAVQDAEIALPDRRDAIKDRGKEHALGENAGREEIEIASVLRAEPAHLRHHLAEQQQPDRGLQRARQQLAGIVTQFAHFGVGDRQHLREIAGDAVEWGGRRRRDRVSHGRVRRVALRERCG